jgi:hypothetical protein
MVDLFPSDLLRLTLAGDTLPESETLRRLALDLPDGYSVFHRLQDDGPAPDFAFAVVAPDGSVLLIEQRNGPLAENIRQLAKYRLARGHLAMERLNESFAGFPGEPRKKLKLDYLLYCPDHPLGLSAAEAGKPAWRRMVDRRDQLSQRVLALSKSGKPHPQHALVCAWLRHELRLIPEVGAYLSAQAQTYLRLTGDLARTLDKLEGHPLRLRIRGTAGCGKSQLALHFYQKAVAAGRRPLLLCYNRPLRDRLARLAAPGGVVETFYGWLIRFLENQGEIIEFPRHNRDYPRLWENALQRLAELPVPDNALFDCLIVDEGQDFETGWYDLLQRFVKPGGDLFWLDDPLQNLRAQPAFVPPDCITFRADVNYRSPRRIAEFIRDTLEIEFDCGNPLPGLGVGVSRYRYMQEQVEIVSSILRQLLDQGFDYHDIAILTCQGVQHSIFARAGEINGVPLRRFTGHYDAEGRQVFSPGALYFDSVYRFKGGQAPAVVLVDIHPEARHLDHERKLLWCGMTRATVRLELVAQEDNRFNRRFFNSPGRN